MVDAKQQAELRAQFNPEGSDLRKMQLRILDILKVVDKVCRDNNIPYWLASGTLIGAVRHGGFIPWDDDLDIEILYSDKKRFMKACMEQLPEGYVLQCHQTDKSYCTNIMKVRDLNSEVHEVAKFAGKKYPIKYKYNGYFIDVFTIERAHRPLIYLSRGPIRLLYIAKYQWKVSDGVLSKLYYLSETFYSILRLLSKVNPFGKYYYHSYGSWFKSRRIKSEILPVKPILFEGAYYMAPLNYDAFLRRIYGDYMQLPAVESRKPSHDVGK